MIMTDWRQRNKTFFDALQVERNVMFIILTLIVLVAALNIISGLIMLVKDKGPDIAILRTMGATRGAILRIFLITGASIGVAGTLRGAAARPPGRQQRRGASAPFLNWLLQRQPVPVRALFPVAAALAWSSRATSSAVVVHDARAVAARDALSVLAGRHARSGRSAAVRVMADPALLARSRSSAATSRARRRSTSCAAPTSRSGPGQSVALVAPSGAGKSTLLHVAGLLEKPDGGEVFVGGEPTAAHGATPRARRCAASRIGFVYQSHHLLPEFSALENVMLPQLIRGLRRAEAADARRASCSPISASASARRIARRNCRAASSSASPSPARSPTRPGILLADEPTGNLDPRTADHVFATLTTLVKATGPRGADRHPQPRPRRRAWTAA